MRAHALVSRLVFDDIQFPFLCLLISGGHAILCIVEGVEDFAILNEATSASPGEVIDKVARAAGLIPKTHYGAVVEEYAKRSTNSNPTPYVTKMPRSKDVDFDFMTIKHRFIDVLNRQTVNLEDFCLNLQVD
jgi:N6-L-threonylcarbamoyladenine synthase